MNQSFEYPSLKVMAPHTYKRISKKIKFALRKFIAKQQVDEFVTYVNQHKYAHQFLSQYNGAPHGLIHLYVNRQFNKQQRLKTMVSDLNKLDTLFPQHLTSEFEIDIAQIDDSLHLVLSANLLDMMEGFFAFTLYNEKREKLYNATFSFLEPDVIIITSTQGPNLTDAKTIMRDLTKRMHGLRPQQFSIWLIQTLAHILNVKSILGVAQNQQVKVRFALKRHIQIDYDHVWPEYKGTLTKEGYWQLPLKSEQKKIEDIASKRRSMYRRRYAMQEQITQSLKEKYGQ